MAAVSGKKYLLVLEGWILDISFDSYDCALKKSDHKCRAKAIVQVTYHEPEEGGPVPPPTLTLVSINSPEWHSHNPDSSKYLADHIMQIMKANITRNPCDRIGNIIFFFGRCNYCYIFIRANGRKSFAPRVSEVGAQQATKG